MESDKKNEMQHIGYGKMAKLIGKVALSLNSLVKKIQNLEHSLKFEQYKLAFGERDDDIYIVTFPKSGTTLVQMILYQLTTSGKLDFNHIYEVSPWIRNASFRKEKVSNVPSPRIIKSHDSYNKFHKKIKGRFIFVYRDGMDVAVSLYHQNKNYNYSELKFDKFIDNFLKGRKKGWFSYTQLWLKNRNKFPILYIKYSDLLQNKEHEIEKIIKFCTLKHDTEAIQRALKYSSFEFMKKHEDKFGVQPNQNNAVYDQFIRKGIEGEGKSNFSDQQISKFNALYTTKVQALENKVFDKKA